MCFVHFSLHLTVFQNQVVLHLLHFALERLVLPLVLPRQLLFDTLQLMKLIIFILYFLIELLYQAVVILTTSKGYLRILDWGQYHRFASFSEKQGAQAFLEVSVVRTHRRHHDNFSAL